MCFKLLFSILAAANFFLFAVSSSASATPQDCRDLHDAAFFDEPAEVRSLLQKGVDPDCRNETGQTPLFTAVEGGSLSSVGHLLLYNVKINVRDEFGETPLTRARSKSEFFKRPGGERYLLIYKGVARLIELAGGIE
ncbi:MAG: ankyrin repeat domain-containing protein [Rhodospirillales bacterium]|nr:ankyrin repeat domain-containing protein [Rhodospirillales bacterium]